MEQPTPTPEPHTLADSGAIGSVLESQVRECFGRVAFSHKTHEKAADLLLDRIHILKRWQIVLSAVTTGGLIATLLDARHTKMPG